MFVNREKKFVYLSLPKTGSYSIHKYFNYTSGHPEPLLHHIGCRDLDPDLYPYFKFAFVRNPWDRLVSAYHDFTLRRECQYSGHVIMDAPLLSEFENFTDFCLRLGSTPWYDNVFFRPQFDSVMYSSGESIDFIGKFENLQCDFDAVCLRLNLPTRSLDHANKGRYNQNYRSYYTTETKRAVAELFLDDLLVFGYEF